MTDSKRAHLGMKTSVDQLTLTKQQMMRQLEIDNRPINYKNNVENNEINTNIISHNSNRIPSDASLKAKSDGSSLLSNLASSLVDNIPVSDFPGRKKNVNQNGYNPKSIYTGKR